MKSLEIMFIFAIKFHSIKPKTRNKLGEQKKHREKFPTIYKKKKKTIRNTSRSDKRGRSTFRTTVSILVYLFTFPLSPRTQRYPRLASASSIEGRSNQNPYYITFAAIVNPLLRGFWLCKVNLQIRCVVSGQRQKMRDDSKNRQTKNRITQKNNNGNYYSCAVNPLPNSQILERMNCIFGLKPYRMMVFRQATR